MMMFFLREMRVLCNDVQCYKANYKLSAEWSAPLSAGPAVCNSFNTIPIQSNTRAEPESHLSSASYITSLKYCNTPRPDGQFYYYITGSCFNFKTKLLKRKRIFKKYLKFLKLLDGAVGRTVSWNNQSTGDWTDYTSGPAQ